MNAFWMMLLAEIVVPAVIAAIKERSSDPEAVNITEIAKDPKAAINAIVNDPQAKSDAIKIVSVWVGGILDLLGKKK